MDRFRLLVAIAGGGSAALLLGALGFQYLADLAPCKLCIWQRWPHLAAVLIALVALARPWAPLALAGAAAAATTAATGIYHAGVETGIFQGPDSCTSGPVSGLSTDALLEQIMTAPLVRCDEIAWSLWGVSMAGWNAILSTLLAAIWLAAWAARTSSRP